MSEAVWDKAFTQGSRALQDRLRKVHAKNPKFQAWLKSSGHGSGESVKQASKEVKTSERVKKLQAKSAQAYGATKGVKVGGEFGSGEIRDTIKPLTRDQHSKVQAAERAAKAAAKAAAPAKAPKAKKPLSKAERMSAIARAVTKAKSKSRFDVPTVDPDDMDHDDLRDLHQSLHVSRAYNEEVEVNEVTKQEAEKALGGPVKTRTGTEPKGKLPLGFRAARNLARKAMKKGASVTEGYEYTNIGHPPEHSVDVDPMPASDPLKLATKRKKPVQYKSGMKDGVRIREESTEETKMNKGRLLAKAIMAKQSKHAMSQNMGEAVKDAADVGEYDYEGDMAKSQLRSILTHAKRLHDMLEDQDNLPEWVQSKITLAQDYILTATDYMEGEMNEEVEQVNEMYGGKVNGKRFDYEADDHELEDDDTLHDVISSQNDHLHHDEVKAIVRSGGYSTNVKVGKNTHRVEHDDNAFNEEVEQLDELSKDLLMRAASKAGRDAENTNNPLVLQVRDKQRDKFKRAADMKDLSPAQQRKLKLQGEALDPVGKEDKDIDNDGDTDKTDVYLHRKRKAIGAAIKKKVAEKMGKKQ